ncbi:MAG: hypothetical protein WC551_00740 [Patescibacteria group bacterium]
MRTFPTAEDIKQFIERASSSQFTAQDLDAFYQRPHLWRPLSSRLPGPEDAQTFWQMVWDELAIEIGGRIIVPSVPRLTDKQRKSIVRYRLIPVYVPENIEDRYPDTFVKPNWGMFIQEPRHEGRIHSGKWVAVETVEKPNFNTVGYPDDQLAAALKLGNRFTVDWTHRSILLRTFASLTGFAKSGARLPTVREWNFIANMFNWLRAHRSLNLPDLGSTHSSEWCLEDGPSIGMLVVGLASSGGLSYVNRSYEVRGFGFRVLFEL